MEKEIKPSEQFKVLALKRSPGMVGNPRKAQYWFCGIEPKGEGKRRKYRSEEKKPLSWSKKGDSYRTSPIYKKIARIVSEITKDCEPFYLGDFFKDKRMNKIFKMNLYPLSFEENSDDWNDTDKNATKFKDRLEYEIWCRLHRHSRLSAQFYNSKKAKVLVCFGKRYCMEFFTAFHRKAREIFAKKIGTEQLRVIYFKESRKWIFIVPFLVRGIRRNDSLDKLGQLIGGMINRKITGRRIKKVVGGGSHG